MESEKVKEIKKALEFNTNNSECMHLPYIDGYKCKIVAYADILTLINELESENELLKVGNERFENNMRAVLEIEKKQAVKEFVEKVKEKALSHCRTINCYELTFIETTVDELLKEYEK